MPKELTPISPGEILLEELWLNLRAQYDAKIASRHLVPKLSRLIRPRPEAA